MKKFITILMLIGFTHQLAFSESIDERTGIVSSCAKKLPLLGSIFIITSSIGDIKHQKELSEKRVDFTPGEIKEITSCYPEGLKNGTAKDSQFSTYCLALHFRAQRYHEKCLTDETFVSQCSFLINEFGENPSS